VWPEVLAIVLCPKGQYRVPAEDFIASRSAEAGCHVRWRVVELWTLPAAELLKLDDPGLAPWIPLMQSAEPPEVVLHQCRDLIDRKVTGREHENLLAVTQVLASLRYNDDALLAILGGDSTMLESPVLTRLFSQLTHEHICDVLEARFRHVPIETVESLRGIRDQARLKELVRWAAVCSDLDAFKSRLGP
jgi:hypothetical protein